MCAGLIGGNVKFVEGKGKHEGEILGSARRL